MGQDTSLIIDDVILPAGFQSYARILHSIPTTDQGDELAERVRWSDLAKRSGRTLDQGTTWSLLLLDQDEVAIENWDLEASEPAPGRLSIHDAKRLIAVLAAYTSTPNDVYYLVWTGWPQPNLSEMSNAPRLQIVDREMVLLHGSISDAVTDFGDHASPFFGLNWRTRVSPTMWWPSDRAWAVVSDIDSQWTVVCGSAQCLASLAAEPELDVVLLSSGASSGS